MKSSSYRSKLLAAAVAILPTAGAWAQTAGTATGDRTPLGQPSGATQTSPMAPGATGKTVVPGNNSTVAGDGRGTALGKTDSVPGQSGEGSGGSSGAK